MNIIKQLSKQAIDAVVRPPRIHYDKSLLPIKIFCSDGHQFVRHPVVFQNHAGDRIAGSIYTGATSVNFDGDGKPTKTSFDVMDGGPCVIYLHRNSSTQKEGTFLIPNLCPYGISVFLFDFAGCGESDGDYISLGLNESKDLRKLIFELYTHFSMGPFILWGRSMGASTTLMLNAQDYVKEGLVVGYIIDSGFSHLSDVCYSFASRFGVPWGLDSLLYWYLRSSVKDVAKFDPNDVNPIEFAQATFTPPALFGHASDDEIVPYQQGVDIFNLYSNPDKEFVELTDGHNGERPKSWLFKCFGFIFRIFNKAHEDGNLKPSTHAKSTGALNEMKDSSNQEEIIGTDEKQRLLIQKVHSDFSLFRLHHIAYMRNRKPRSGSRQETSDAHSQNEPRDLIESDMYCHIYKPE